MLKLTFPEDMVQFLYLGLSRKLSSCGKSLDWESLFCSLHQNSDRPENPKSAMNSVSSRWSNSYFSVTSRQFWWLPLRSQSKTVHLWRRVRLRFHLVFSLQRNLNSWKNPLSAIIIDFSRCSNSNSSLTTVFNSSMKVSIESLTIVEQD